MKLFYFLKKTKGELKLSIVGLIFGISSVSFFQQINLTINIILIINKKSVFVATYSILVKQKLALVGHDHWRLLA